MKLAAKYYSNSEIVQALSGHWKKEVKRIDVAANYGVMEINLKGGNHFVLSGRQIVWNGKRVSCDQLKIKAPYLFGKTHLFANSCQLNG